MLKPTGGRSRARFLVSPQRRRKVEFAQALARATEEAAPLPSHVPEPRTSWQAFWNPIRAWTPAMQFVGAAGAVICVAGGTWLAIENVSMRSRLSAMEAVRRDLEGRSQTLRQELSQAQARANAPALKQNTAPSTPSRSPLIASLILIAGPTRAESRTEQLLLSRETQIAHIEIQLEPRDDYPSFRAEVRTRGGKEVLSFGALLRRTPAKHRACRWTFRRAPFQRETTRSRSKVSALAMLRRTWATTTSACKSNNKTIAAREDCSSRAAAMIRHICWYATEDSVQGHGAAGRHLKGSLPYLHSMPHNDAVLSRRQVKAVGVLPTNTPSTSISAAATGEVTDMAALSAAGLARVAGAATGGVTAAMFVGSADRPPGSSNGSRP